MIDEIIGNIVESEKQAEEIIKNAEKQAKSMIYDAQKQAIKIEFDAKQSIKNDIQEATKNANYIVVRQISQSLEDSKKLANNIKLEAQKNIDKAADFIIGSLTSKNGNS